MALQVWLPLNKSGDLRSKGLMDNNFGQTGPPTFSNNGKIGGCYIFDGSDDCLSSATNKLAYWANKEISFACWFKCDKVKASGTIMEIGADLCLNYNYSSSGIKFGYWRCYKNSSGNRTGDEGWDTNYYNSNDWHHVVITFDHQYNNIYVDGVLSITIDRSSKYTYNWYNMLGNSSYTNLGIGRSFGSGSSFAGGSICDVRYYDHALSEKEVKEISKGLILHYKLDGNDIGITIPRNGGLIPDGIELYEYLLSSGTLWIDTGVTLSLTDKFEFETDFTYSPANNRACPFYGTENYLTGFMAQYHYTNNNFYSLWIRNVNYGGSNIAINAESRMYSKTVIDVPNKTWAIIYNATSANGTYSNLITDTTSTVKFFGNDLYNKYVAKCYYFKIKRNDLLIRNFIPCTYLGEPGMWDTVENKFYRNQGTGLFTLGNKITLKEYEYLQSSGTLYIDTLYNPNNNTRVLTELMMTTNGDAQGMFGSYSGNNWTDRSYGLYYAGSSGNAYSNYVSDTVFPRSKIPYNIKHLIDKNKNLLYIDNALVLTHSTATFQASISMHIFKLNFSSNPRYANMRLYTFKIYNNDILARDFIPVSYNGTPGLWDKVEWKFYANAGSGNFTLGPEKTVQQDAPIFYDSSGYCNHGSITGTLTTNSDSPRYTASTTFNGSSRITSNNINLPGTSLFTISCWVYRTGSQNYLPPFWLGNGSSSLGIAIHGSSILRIEGGNGTNRFDNTGSTGVPVNTWTHLVLVYNGSNVIEYLNGSQVNSIAHSYGFGSTLVRMYVGYFWGASFTGRLSDVRLYATALSEDDIKELYNTSAFVTNNGVFAEYELYEDNLSDVKKRGLLETANFYENGAESGYALDTDKTRVASNYIISEDFIEI